MIQKTFGSSLRALAVRSSSSQEDLPNQAGAGLYDSFLDIDTPNKLRTAITDVWLSLFTKRAVMSRRQLQTHALPLMAVLIQEQVRSDYCFILHTRDPNTKEQKVYAEVAVGLGETLCGSNQQGTPYRLQIDGGKVKVTSFCNYSLAVVPEKSVAVNYTEVEMSLNP
jgi:phosphoenolpyruvate synthase/pyruvate phosphate dikinase